MNVEADEVCGPTKKELDMCTVRSKPFQSLFLSFRRSSGSAGSIGAVLWKETRYLSSDRFQKPLRSQTSFVVNPAN